MLEFAGGLGVIVGLAWKPLALLALIGLAALMVGAIRQRGRVHDSSLMIALDGVVIAVVILTFITIIS